MKVSPRESCATGARISPRARLGAPACPVPGIVLLPDFPIIWAGSIGVASCMQVAGSIRTRIARSALPVENWHVGLRGNRAAVSANRVLAHGVHPAHTVRVPGGVPHA